jgi:glutamate 5-kinase
MAVVVVKIGTSTLVDAEGRFREEVLEARVRDLVRIRRQGHAPVLVSSAAIACGLARLGIAERPTALPDLQAASAVGQGVLFERYLRAFGQHDVVPAQVLLTSGDLERRASYLNARNTVMRLLELGTIPVVNENDTTATDDITFGDNDVLAAQVAIMLRADLLVLLTDQDGLYTMDPRKHGSAELVRKVTDETQLAALEVGDASRRGAGGMRGKTAAALMAAAANVRTVIANGSRPGVLAAAAGGEDVGTQILARSTSASAFKLWLRYAKPVRGTLEVDAGAVHALAQGGSSLLPVGVKAVHGSFAAGDAVAIVGPGGTEVARGISTMSARDLRRARGLRSDELRALNPQLEDEVVHRDRLVLVGEEAG